MMDRCCETQTFNLARRYRETAPNTVVLVLLDEVGLAEQSPHLPLKVGDHTQNAGFTVTL